jgi:predicted AAA+ superfamily ATPase
MFDRRAVLDIKSWYSNTHRKPLIIRGARQVGKTTAVSLAAKALKVPLYSVNLERYQSLESSFSSFDIDKILFALSTVCGEVLNRDSNGILFLDEAQATPSAYACLRYFYEDAPNLAVVLTGSLLDQVLENYHLPIPVGRVEHYFMGPISFNEFLESVGETALLNTLSRVSTDTFSLIPNEIHEKLLEQVRRYTLVGGMPHAVQLAIDTHFDHRTINQYQVELIEAYKADFSKYRGKLDSLTLNTFFEGILSQVGAQFSHKMARQMTDRSSGDNRLLNSALEQFREARIFYRVRHSSADSVPLGAESNSRISKFLFVDLGLLLAAQDIPVQSIMNKPLELANNGVVAEQFVGQHLLSGGPNFKAPSLYYWHPPRNEGQAEVDFLFQQEGKIYPIEVKAGTSGRLRSLHFYMLKKKADVAIRIHSGKASVETIEAQYQGKKKRFTLLNVPFYMIDKVPELIREIQASKTD